MQGLNGSQGQLNAPDFERDLRQAQSTGDFDFVIETAKKSHRLMTDFYAVIENATFSGKDVETVAMGLRFMAKMIENSASQINGLKQAERATREALKASLKTKGDPEKPEDPPSAPSQEPHEGPNPVPPPDSEEAHG